MKNNKVTVYVGGRRFVLVSSESEKYVKGVAGRVNERLADITKNYGQLDAWGCAVMAALDFADDEQKALGKKAELVFQADKVLKQADKLSKQIVDVKKQNAEIQSEYDDLLEQYEDLKKKNSNLTMQYNELKKFLDKQVGLNKTTGNLPSKKAETNSKADSTAENLQRNQQDSNKSDIDKNSTEDISKGKQQVNGKTEITHGTKPVVNENVEKSPQQNSSSQDNKVSQKNIATQSNIASQEKAKVDETKKVEGTQKSTTNNVKNTTQNQNKVKKQQQNKAQTSNQALKNSKSQDKENLLVKNKFDNNEKQEKDDIIKPQSAADVMHKGYVPLRQYSLFDDENK